MPVFENITPKQFLSEYWQKKPLLIRQAFPGLELPFSPEELAGLACDTDAASRIVIENGTHNTSWQTKHAPFTDEDFTLLPDSHWTLLVNDIERYVPELGNFIEPFRFIPDWRIDDVMVSYAADQGSVGPHTDEYDVFLVQGMGKRRWKIITREDYPNATLADNSLSILEEFEADQEWLLETGDMLYLPPNIPHHGIAEGPCMTLSVGFRAPSQQELVQAWIESVTENPTFKQRFADAGRPPQSSPGEINQQDISRLTSLIIEGIQPDPQQISQWLGKYLTETRGTIDREQVKHGDIEKEGHSVQYISMDFERQSWLRFAYIDSGDIIHFYADGRQLSLPGSTKADIQGLCADYYYTAESLSALWQHPNFRILFNELIAEGGVYPVM